MDNEIRENLSKIISLIETLLLIIDTSEELTDTLRTQMKDDINEVKKKLL